MHTETTWVIVLIFNCISVYWIWITCCYSAVRTGTEQVILLNWRQYNGILYNLDVFRNRTGNSVEFKEKWNHYYSYCRMCRLSLIHRISGIKKHFLKLVWGPDVIHETALNIPTFCPSLFPTSWLSPEISRRWQEHLWLPCSETSTPVCCRIVWTSSWLLLLSASRR
jgi:hypothetical protein